MESLFLYSPLFVNDTLAPVLGRSQYVHVNEMIGFSPLFSSGDAWLSWVKQPNYVLCEIFKNGVKLNFKTIIDTITSYLESFELCIMQRKYIYIFLYIFITGVYYKCKCTM